MQKGLSLLAIDKQRSLVLDADNVFWGITAGREKDVLAGLPRKMLGLYTRLAARLDRQMQEFRFGQRLSAIYIDPTDKCNASCPYCYVPPQLRKNGRSMDKNGLNFILDKIYRYRRGRGEERKKLVIVFHASEPLLVKDVVFQAIEKFKDKFLFGLQTNALLMDRKDARFLIKHRVGVGISLDSHNPSRNNRLRSGNFAQACAALDWFCGYPGLNVITTITKDNLCDLSGIVRFLHKKKVGCVLLNPLRLTQAYARKLKPAEDALTREFLRAVDTAISLTRNTGRQIIIANFANILLGIVSPFARRLMCDISPCGGGRCFFTITASGEMIPCGEFIGLRGFSGGNIFQHDIGRAMSSAAFNKVRGRFAENVRECAECALRNICGSPCPAELHSLKRFRKKSVFCDFYKQIIRYAFQLISQGKEEYVLRREIRNNLTYEYKAC